MSGADSGCLVWYRGNLEAFSEKCSCFIYFPSICLSSMLAVEKNSSYYIGKSEK